MHTIDTRFPYPPPEPLPHTSEGAFGSLLCGIDASRSCFEAARQAAILARPGATLDLVSVATTRGVGLNAQSALSPERAEEALRRAQELASVAQVDVSIDLVHEPEPTAVLLERAAGHELVVVGSHGSSRVEGILLGSTSSALVHEAEVPVLVARRPPGEEIGGPVVVASDGSPDAARAIDLAAKIALAYGSAIHVVVAAWGIGDRLESILEMACAPLVAAGLEPRTHTLVADPPVAIAQAARSVGAAVVLVGSRGLGGISALGSVSEVVAHEAPCSVLVARPSTPH